MKAPLTGTMIAALAAVSMAEASPSTKHMPMEAAPQPMAGIGAALPSSDASQASKPFKVAGDKPGDKKWIK